LAVKNEVFDLCQSGFLTISDKVLGDPAAGRAAKAPLAMWLELARRIRMIVLFVAVATGVAVPAAHADLHHGQVIATAAIGMDGGGTCVHDGCGSNLPADMQGTCFAPCAGATMLSVAAPIFYFAVGHDVLTPSLGRAMIDRSVPPDPHPPKQHELI
jgi:hypothetical protein